MNELIILDLKFQFRDVEDWIHPVILRDDHTMVLVDCAYTGFLPQLEQAMKEQNLSCTQLTHVFITHQDHDHMGALAELKQKYSQVQVVASVLESPYISGKKKFLRLEQAEAMQPYLPPEQQAFGLAFCDILKGVSPVAVDIQVRGGDVFSWCGGCTVLDTPGHTPGHVSLLMNGRKTVIAGDAAVIEHGVLTVANPQFAWDLAAAERSLQTVKNCGAKSVICYHGGCQSLCFGGT